MSPYQTVGTQKQIRITLNLSVDDDFNARDIDYAKLFDLNDYEECKVYIEDVN